MKTSVLLAAVALAGLVAGAAAQETTPADATPAPAAGSTPTALFPDVTPGASPAPSPTGAGGRHGGHARGRGHRNSQYATDAAVSAANDDPLDVRVAYRKDKTLAMVREPGLRDLLLEADAARTDDAKRAILKVYYTKLYATVRKVDPSPKMKAHVALLLAANEQQFNPKRRALSGEDDLEGVGRNAGRNRR